MTTMVWAFVALVAGAGAGTYIGKKIQQKQVEVEFGSVEQEKDRRRAEAD